MFYKFGKLLLEIRWWSPTVSWTTCICDVFFHVAVKMLLKINCILVHITEVISHHFDIRLKDQILTKTSKLKSHYVFNNYKKS